MRKLFLAGACAVLLAAATHDPSPPSATRAAETEKVMPAAAPMESLSIVPMAPELTIVFVDSASLAVSVATIERGTSVMPMASDSISYRVLLDSLNSRPSARLSDYRRYEPAPVDSTRTRLIALKITPHYRV